MIVKIDSKEHSAKVCPSYLACDVWTIFPNITVFLLVVLTGTENFNILNVKRNWIDRIIITPPNSLFMNPRCSISTINTVPDRTYLGGDYCRRCHLIPFRFFKNTIWTNSFCLWKVYSFNFIDIVFIQQGRDIGVSGSFIIHCGDIYCCSVPQLFENCCRFPISAVVYKVLKIHNSLKVVPM